MLQKCVNCRASSANLEPQRECSEHVEINTKFIITTVRLRCKLCHTVYGKTIEKSVAKKLIAKTLCLQSDNKCNNTLHFCLTQAGITQDNAENFLGIALIKKIPLTKMLTVNLKNDEIKEIPSLFWRKIAEKIAKETAHITFGITKQKAA